MLFPWLGMLEQMRLADTLVHYDDVQFSKGGFTNRVQVKTETGIHWMTVPLRKFKLGSAIDDVQFAPASAWRHKHLALLTQSFRATRNGDQAVALARDVYAQDYTNIGCLARASMLSLGNYFGLLEGKHVLDVRSLDIGGSGSSRVLEIVRAVGGTTYITGHGARNYLDHSAFERAGVQVEYMHYEHRPYPQCWGDFTPYVTGLDLVANLGQEGRDYISPRSIPWRQFLSSM